jgi:NitT/TauT family transport system substrate-binding protein
MMFNSTKRRQAALAIVASAALIGGLVGCSAPGPDAKSASTVRLGVGSAISDSLYRVDSSKIAGDHGIDLRISAFDRGFQGVQAAAAGSLDGGISVEYPLLTLVGSGVKNVVAVAACTTAPDIKLVAAKGISSAADLKGKHIGVTAGSSMDFAFRHYLEVNNMSVDDVTLVNLPGTAQIAALAKGEIDGLVNVEPQLSQALETVPGSAYLDPDVNSAYVSRVWLSLNKPWAEAHHAAVVDLLKSLNSTADYIKNKPDEAYDVIANELNLDASAVAKTVADVPYTWGCYIDDDAVGAMASVADFVKSNGQGEVDLATVIDTSYLQEADPDAVKLSADSLALLKK